MIGHKWLCLTPELDYPLPPTGPGCYTYTADLVALDQCTGSDTPVKVLSGISTPLKRDVWEQALQKHPDKFYAQYIFRGVREGFRIGADRNHRVRPALHNLQSACKHLQVVADYLANEERFLKGSQESGG